MFAVDQAGTTWFIARGVPRGLGGRPWVVLCSAVTNERLLVALLATPLVWKYLTKRPAA